MGPVPPELPAEGNNRVLRPRRVRSGLFAPPTAMTIAVAIVLVLIAYGPEVQAQYMFLDANWDGRNEGHFRTWDIPILVFTRDRRFRLAGPGSHRHGNHRSLAACFSKADLRFSFAGVPRSSIRNGAGR